MLFLGGYAHNLRIDGIPENVNFFTIPALPPSLVNHEYRRVKILNPTITVMVPIGLDNSEATDLFVQWLRAQYNESRP